MRRRRGRIGGVLLLLLCHALPLAACSDAGSGGFRTEERDGLTWILNTGPGVWGDADPPPVGFELEQTFGVALAPEEAMLGSIGSLDVDDEGSVYVLDRQSGRLVAFGAEGDVRWRVGSEGEGPGQFQRPRGMALDGAGSLFVANQGGGVLDQFDLSGSFLGRYPFRPSGLSTFSLDGFLASGRMVGHDFLGGTVGTRLAVMRRGEPLELVADGEIDLYPELEIPAGVSAGVGVGVAGEEVMVGHDGRYEIRVFDGELDPVRVVARPDVDHLVRAGVAFVDGGRGGIAPMSQLAPPLVFPDGRWLVYSSWPTGVEDPDEWVRRTMLDRQAAPERGPQGRALDFFAPDGRYLGGLHWVGEGGPGIGRPSAIGADGRLYTTVSDPFPQVRRYRVIFEDR